MVGRTPASQDARRGTRKRTEEGAFAKGATIGDSEEGEKGEKGSGSWQTIGSVLSALSAFRRKNKLRRGGRESTASIPTLTRRRGFTISKLSAASRSSRAE